MSKPRTFVLLALASRPSRKAGSVGNLGFLKIPCHIIALCIAMSIASSAQSSIPLFSFDGTDGAYPGAVLIQAADGNFYGTTSGGGANSGGTIFQMTPSGTLVPFHNFCSQPNCTDGSNPVGLVQATDGNFYGTTSLGGATGDGTVFQITPEGSLTTLYSFCAQTNCTDGSNPGGLIQATDGNFYGTTSSGGTPGYGTVFQITPEGSLTTLYSFCSQTNCADGYLPSSVIQAADGNLYGTTLYGGLYPLNFGTIFKITTSGTLTTLLRFNGDDGIYPATPLVQAADGNLYGTTDYGGGAGGKVQGVFFRITLTGILTKLRTLPLQGGGTLNLNGLLQATDGNFYAAGFGGGANHAGAICELTSAGSLTFLYSFCSQTNCLDGRDGVGLVQATDGNFYGTTSGGGANNDGTVFRLVPAATPSPTFLSFGNQALSETSTARTVRLTNGGKAPLAISGITIKGNFAILANTCGAALAAGRACEVDVNFTPAGLGKVTGTLTFTDNATSSPLTVPLSGTGAEPATLTPIRATYASQAVGTTSAAKTFTLTNNQSAALTSILITTGGDFAVSATTCTTSLAAKSKCTTSVTFTPTATGKRTGQLSVSDSASNNPQTSTLTGTGN